MGKAFFVEATHAAAETKQLYRSALCAALLAYGGHGAGTGDGRGWNTLRRSSANAHSPRGRRQRERWVEAKHFSSPGCFAISRYSIGRGAHVHRGTLVWCCSPQVTLKAVEAILRIHG